MWQLLFYMNVPVFFSVVVVGAVVAFLGVLLKRGNERLVTGVCRVVLAVSLLAYVIVLVEPVDGWGQVGGGGVNVSLIPFDFLSGEHVTENSLHWEEWMLNILLFLPLGIVAALLFTHWVRWLLGPLVSLTVEVAQAVLATGRQSALDDLLANSLGYLIGVTLVLLAGAVLSRRGRAERVVV
ncbi:VanZ family protein [Nocardiopsis sp. LDBS1602]|uniref:VanZ family protein n=1 Tax=Nocardiopsis sp. LDBS1602 TaxID=3109597 RepID=UPI002DB6CEE0|nr:VanZ family protein [Nocardiopsis sp. LDBS1602]MEC3891076.1 VanZ family protein [Nocardiopsis sp. LDBS1602]